MIVQLHRPIVYQHYLDHGLGPPGGRQRDRGQVDRVARTPRAAAAADAEVSDELRARGAGAGRREGILRVPEDLTWQPGKCLDRLSSGSAKLFQLLLLQRSVTGLTVIISDVIISDVIIGDVTAECQWGAEQCQDHH